MINIAIGALIISIWSVILFFGKSIGLSMLLFAIPLIYYTIYLLEKHNKIENKKAKVLIIPIILLSSTYFIFDNTFLRNMNIIMIPLLVIIMIVELLGDKIALNQIVSKISKIVIGPFSYIGETLEKIADEIKERLKLKSIKNKNIGKIIKSIIIIIPIVLVIIFLLASADEDFKGIFVKILNTIINSIGKIRISGFIVRSAITILIFIYLSSFFYNIALKLDKEIKKENEKEQTKDSTTIKILLGVLNLIYLIFCAIQIKSLFIANASINYSEYARQGFFQLMVVSIINLVTILLSKRREKEENIKENKYINIMCIIMIVFTFIILISSAVRMYFYESLYGYTFLRLLVYIILITESLLLIPTIFYILNKKVKLLQTYFIIIISMYIVTNFINIDNVIAKRNVDRYINTGKIDMYYLEENMGNGAINQIARILEIENEDETIKTEVENYLSKKSQAINSQKRDFRDINLSEIFAKNIIEKNKLQDVQNSLVENGNNEVKKNSISKIETNNSKQEEELSMQTGGVFNKIGNIIVYINDFDSSINTFDIENKKCKKLCTLENGSSKIYFDGEYIYSVPHYYSGKGIYKIDLEGNVTKIYNGASIQLYITNDKIYFTDQIGYDQINGTPQGNLCVMEKDGQNKKVIIENVKNYFKICNNQIYYTSLNNKSIYKANIDGSNQKELAIGRTYITSVTDKYLTYIDYSNGEKQRILYFENGQNVEIGSFGSIYSQKEGTYVYTRKLLDDNNNTLYKIEENNFAQKELWKGESLNFLMYVHNDYAYFRDGDGIYRINLKNGSNQKEKLKIGYSYFIGGKAYCFNINEGIITKLNILNLEDMETEEIMVDL